MNMETRFDLTRHPEKKGKFLERQDNPEEKIALPVEGLIQAQNEAARFAEEFSQAPEGAVFWGLTSNVSRTQEARFIFDMELGVMAKKIGDAMIIDLNEKMPNESIMKEIKNNEGKKIILVNGPVHPGLGMHDYNMDEFVKLIDELGSEEKLLSKWKQDPEIAKKIGVDYEQVADGFKKLMDDIEKTKQEIFPDRELWVKGFGHSFEIEVGLATYANKTAGEILDSAGGKIIKTMESAHITIKPDGSKKIEYRDKELN
jgi:hypothetical protein